MGILSGLLGNATEIDVQQLEKDFEAVLSGNEQIEKAEEWQPFSLRRLLPACIKRETRKQHYDCMESNHRKASRIENV
jgi:hypothetical protein